MSAEYRTFIKMAETGYYDLFPVNWIEESLKDTKIPHFKKANRTVKEVFKKLSKHKTLERKKTLLMSFTPEERNEFIRSFYSLVEYNIIEGNKTLQ